MRGWLAVAAVAASLVGAAAPARAGDPIMPLSDVRAGMRCTGYSVVRGVEPAAFDVEIVDVVDGDGTTDGPRILVEVSGEAVDSTGLGPGFSGSPIHCDAGDGIARNAGAISESVGEYGGKVALATPIEAILGVPVDQPRGTTGAGARAGDAGAEPRARGARAHPLRDVRPLAAPLTVSGLGSRMARALTRVAARQGRAILTAPAAPLTPFPVVTLRPGSAVSAGYSGGDLAVTAIGTVAYVDGDRVWAFGHALDGIGPRGLLLQDAYVYRVINNPNQLGDFGSTYKLAAGGRTLGLVSSDGLAAIAGRTGVPAPAIPVTVTARDVDRDVARQVRVQVADETGAGNPSGQSPVSFVAPLAVGQAVNAALGSAPLRSAGSACIEIRFRELPEPVEVCNRYVGATLDGVIPGFGTVVAAQAASDLAEALTRVDLYRFAPPHIASIDVTIDVRRGDLQAFLRDVRLPRTVRRGRTYRARVTLQRVGGGRERRRYDVRIPRRLGKGRRTLTFTGRDSDIPGGELLGDLVIEFGGGGDGAGDSGPTSLQRLAASIERLRRWDGVRLKAGGRRVRAFRDPELRLSGRARTPVRVR